MLGKLRSGLLLLYLYITGSIWVILRQAPRGPFAMGREAYRAMRRTARVARIVLLFLRGRSGMGPLVPLCQEVQADPRRLYRHPVFACILVRPLMAKQQYERVIETLTPLTEPKPERAICYGVRGMAYLQLGQYKEALADLTRCGDLSPYISRLHNYGHQVAFLHGQRGEVEAARAAMCQQFELSAPRGTADALARFLRRRLSRRLSNLCLHGSTGVFIGSHPLAVGHAILDPFHYLNLFGRRFDNLVMVHPNLKGYSAATRLTMSLLEPHVETVVCDDADVLSFAWQHLGELRRGELTFLVYNYWALNRLACQARQDPSHPMHHGRTYLRPPPKMVGRAEALLRRNGLRLSGPLVVVHSREHGYHEQRVQSFRNTDARNYVPALRKLIARGFQVVRIGDRKMTSLRQDVPGLVELPMMEPYAPVLDPYLISRCEFMVSCQSGPCSYARAFGKPNLVVNAVYHYTLLPEHNELIAFKNYRDAATRRLLGVEEIFRRGMHRFDRARHFEEHGVEVEDMTPDELEASVDEMVTWLRDPGRPETPAQREFRRVMNYYAANNDPDAPLASPMSDYIGYGLPECRTSDATAALRPGYLPTVGECAPTALAPAA